MAREEVEGAPSTRERLSSMRAVPIPACRSGKGPSTMRARPGHRPFGFRARTMSGVLPQAFVKGNVEYSRGPARGVPPRPPNRPARHWRSPTLSRRGPALRAPQGPAAAPRSRRPARRPRRDPARSACVTRRMGRVIGRPSGDCAARQRNPADHAMKCGRTCGSITTGAAAPAPRRPAQPRPTATQGSERRAAGRWRRSTRRRRPDPQRSPRLPR